MDWLNKTTPMDGLSLLLFNVNESNVTRNPMLLKWRTLSSSHMLFLWSPLGKDLCSSSRLALKQAHL